MNTYTNIQVDLEEAILLVRLNRPDKRNALDVEMQDELTEALQEAATAAEV